MYVILFKVTVLIGLLLQDNNGTKLEKIRATKLNRGVSLLST